MDTIRDVMRDFSPLEEWSSVNEMLLFSDHVADGLLLLPTPADPFRSLDLDIAPILGSIGRFEEANRSLVRYSLSGWALRGSIVNGRLILLKKLVGLANPENLLAASDEIMRRVDGPPPEHERLDENTVSGIRGDAYWTAAMLNAYLGRTEASAEYARRAARYFQLPGTGSLSEDIPIGVRAVATAVAGDPATALELLGSQKIESSYQFLSISFEGAMREWDRYHRAELLIENGRLSEAAEHLHPMEYMSYQLRGLVYRLTGQLYDRLGEPEKAMEFYTRFATFWADADPEFQPIVDVARSRIDALAAQIAKEGS
jgi:tetratricopeptide (TPR) repeat protein